MLSLRQSYAILVGSRVRAQLAYRSSFVVNALTAFAIGALVPLVPYFLGASTVLPGLLLPMLALFVCGAVVTQVTSRSWWYGGLRMMLLGAAAAGLTYGFGSLVGGSGIA